MSIWISKVLGKGMDKEQNIMESAKFWAKTTKDGQPGKSVLSHMQDVKAVANILLTGKESILSTFNLDKKAISNFAGLHDI